MAVEVVPSPNCQYALTAPTDVLLNVIASPMQGCVSVAVNDAVGRYTITAVSRLTVSMQPILSVTISVTV